MKDYVLTRRQHQREVFVPLRHNAGHAQADFGEALAVIGGVERPERKNIPIDVMKGVMGINAIIFGICFTIMAFLTFLPPIVLTGLIFLCSLLAYFTSGRVKNSGVNIKS